MIWKKSMLKAISNTSPLLYLHRIKALDLCPGIFDKLLTTPEVSRELLEGRQLGYNCPDISRLEWIEIVEARSMPSEWFALDLGPGEISAMALAFDKPGHIILLDDMLARRIASAAGLQVWGTLKIILKAKSLGLIDQAGPLINQLTDAGMWVTPGIKQRILRLANET
ncbi:MAG: DUF3368 domain-containing protein [Desulfonatronovibrio sp.]